MTTKELFRAEIERRKGYISVTHFAEDLLSFLDTLPDEPVSDCHDLEEAAEKSARQYYVDGGYSPFPNTEMASHIAGFKAGAEWAASYLRYTPKKVSEDLEEAARAFVGVDMDCDELYEYEIGIAAFKEGAEWQYQKDRGEFAKIKAKTWCEGFDACKEQMMEGAAEGTVIDLGETYKDLSLSVNAKELNQVLQPLGVGDGNKVKIIIVKEGE